MTATEQKEVATHTPGPWCVSSVNPLEVWGTGKNGFKIATVTDNDDNHRDPVAMADSRLIAAAPDHAMYLSASIRGVAKWEPFVSSNVNAGEVCCRGMRYTTQLDEFGCPALTPHIRAAIAKATHS